MTRSQQDQKPAKPHYPGDTDDSDGAGLQSDGSVQSDGERREQSEGRGLQKRPHINEDTKDQDVEPNG